MKKKIVFIICSIMVLLISVLGINFNIASAEEMKLHFNAKSALIMDYSTGKVLYEQNIKERRPIASMVKIMSLLLIFEEIEKGNLTLEQEIPVSQNASGMGGSQAFLDANNNYNAGELIKSIVVASANDSCVAMAEHIAGSVEAFVERMNNKIEGLGLNDTYYVNCTGLPAPNQYSCAYDVGVMTRELLNHKQFFEYSRVWMYDFVHPSGRITGLTNTNKLIRFYEGCDGGKTGFTNEAMSCLSATAKRGNTRLIAVALGCNSSKERNAEITKMFNYGFANYDTKQLVFKDIELDKEIPVANGKQKTVKAIPEKDYYYLIKRGKEINSKIICEPKSMKAPIKKGDIVGKLKVIIDDEEVAEINLLSCNDVKKVNYLDVIDDILEQW